jgi:HSP90 family molecular chaperone
MNTQSFVVDASLLQELGERLIGRPAIALGELVKNSFDADATVCRIEFGDDEIVVADNGTGMSESDFLTHWMRIATTHKVDDRVSARFKRPLTGSKGIGRLSAQFLADALTLESTPAGKSPQGIYAAVDWSTAIRGNELSTVKVSWERRANIARYAAESPFGTRITLRGLKNEWDVDAFQDLGTDVWMLRSPFKAPARAR